MTGKRLALTIVLGVVGLALSIGALVGGALWLSADRRALAHEFLGSVRNGRYDLAYELTSKELRATTPLAAFEAYLDDRVPNVRQSTSEWINGETGDLFTRNCMDAWLSGPGLDDDSVYLIMVKQGGEWRITEVTDVQISECD